MLNTILWGNEPIDEPIWVNVDAGVLLILYSDIQGGLEDIGNIDVDPMFVDEENGDYRLKPNSPCLNADYLTSKGNSHEKSVAVSLHQSRPRYWTGGHQSLSM